MRLHDELMLIVALWVLALLSLLFIVQMVTGRFQPPERVWRGVGGSLYLFGFCLAMADLLITREKLAFMLWGLAIAKGHVAFKILQGWKTKRHVDNVVRSDPSTY